MKRKGQIDKTVRMGGEAFVRVLNSDGSIAYESKPQKNLVLYPGIEEYLGRTPNSGNSNTPLLASQWSAARAGTDSTPNFTVPDGTFARTGTTVTRSTGTGEFGVGDVGNTIKFSTGEEAYIVSRTSATEVETRESGTIAATTIVIWRTNQTNLGALVKTASFLFADASSDLSTNTATGECTLYRVHNFSTEVAAQTYNEIGLALTTSSGNLMTRVVLDTPVNVGIGQQLQSVYTIVFSLGSFLTPQPLTLDITGWPRAYEIASIVHSGTDFDVTFTEDHHYLVGGEVTITNAIPEEIAVSTYASDPTEFTITTATPHGLSAADTVEIAGASVGAYNGSWTVAAVDSTTVFRITSAANPGAASGGTVRQSTPATYFNGTWTIASLPTTDSIRITDATIATGAPAGSGDLEGDLSATGQYTGLEMLPTDPATLYLAGVWNRSTRFKVDMYTGTEPTIPAFGNTAPATQTDTTVSVGTECEADLSNHSMKDVMVFAVDRGNSNSIWGLLYNNDRSTLGFCVKFDQPQRKDSGYTLQVGFQTTFRPALA